MRWLVVALLVVHGLIHFMGFAKAFGLAELEALARPISRGMGVVWLLAGLGFLVAALLLLRSPRIWWWVALASVVLSQAVIVASWSDAKWGTVANLLVLAAVVYGAASQGPWSFRATYRDAVAQRLATLPADPPPVTEEEVARLPEPVGRYLRVAGSVGRPRPTWFRAVWRGRIRGGPDEPWMTFTAEQHNFTAEPARFFLMDATRAGLPVDVLHAYRAGEATMRVRLLSLFSMVDEKGPAMDRAETVTVLNDLALMAPGALVDPAIGWEAVDDTTARARYTVADRTVTATLRFNGAGELVDFVSDDRFAADSDGSSPTPVRWSTPVSGYRDAGDGRRVFSRGSALWHPEDGEPWAYIEADILEVEVGPDG